VYETEGQKVTINLCVPSNSLKAYFIQLLSAFFMIKQ